jgi:hypothetical protein
MDVVRWIILVLLFGGLFALWLWSKRQARIAQRLGKNPAAGFQVTQKRWLDQRTGVCLVEIDGQGYLLAYTVGGGVSWQPVAKKPAAAPEIDSPKTPALTFESILSEADLS